MRSLCRPCNSVVSFFSIRFRDLEALADGRSALRRISSSLESSTIRSFTSFSIVLNLSSFEDLRLSQVIASERWSLGTTVFYYYMILRRKDFPCPLKITALDRELFDIYDIEGEFVGITSLVYAQVGSFS